VTDSQQLLADRYRLVRALARHGGSATWAAEDSRTGEACVVKELSVSEVVRAGSTEHSWDENDFTKLVDLFEREARVLANLDHPGIPAFIDHFDLHVDGDRRLYTVQEFVEGDTLQALVEGGRHFTEDEALRVAREVASLLGYLHGRSPPLIHRDVKPSNIILGKDGRLHLVDFGSVRNIVEPGAMEGKTIVGTYGYMPMEQYEGRAVPQSDFYALGMTLVFLLSHRDPTGIPRKGLSLDFRSYVSVSERFSRAIEWMIAPVPEERPPTAAAIVETLDSKLQQLPDLHRPRLPADAPDPGAATTTRRVLALMAGVAALLAGTAGFLINGLPFLEEPEEEAEFGITEAPAGLTPTTGPTPRPVVTRDGELRIDVDRDFRYEPTGFAMGRAAFQTALPALYREPPPELGFPETGTWDELTDAWFGSIPLGAPTKAFHYAISSRDGGWVLWVDRDGNGDLTNDGPPQGNEGTGNLLAAAVAVTTQVTHNGEARVRPYDLWIWFTASSTGGPPAARFYARHHYRGVVSIGDASWEATVFEQNSHDARYRDAGICIDMDRDGECFEDAELFHDGDRVVTPAGSATLVLDYP
jgi:hypothetical protein